LGPYGHAVPQLPQWLGFEASVTQVPPQFVCPVGQVSWQLPFVHTVPAAQTLPQAPQFWPSVLRLTHWVPHLE
jgi:hypothetical protein